MHQLLELSDHLLVSSPRPGTKPGGFQSGNNREVSCPDWETVKVLSEDFLWSPGITIWNGNGYQVGVHWVLVPGWACVSGQAAQVALGTWGKKASWLLLLWQSGWVPCWGCLSERPYVDRSRDSSQIELTKHMETPGIGQAQQRLCWWTGDIRSQCGEPGHLVTSH